MWHQPLCTVCAVVVILILMHFQGAALEIRIAVSYLCEWKIVSVFIHRCTLTECVLLIYRVITAKWNNNNNKKTLIIYVYSMHSPFSNNNQFQEPSKENKKKIIRACIATYNNR